MMQLIHEESLLKCAPWRHHLSSQQEPRDCIDGVLICKENTLGLFNIDIVSINIISQTLIKRMVNSGMNELKFNTFSYSFRILE